MAISTSQFIHRKILTRLFWGWLFLSLVIGSFVLGLEINRIQHSVHELALSESMSFSGESAHNLEHMDISARQHLTALAQQLVNHHFLIVELYDHNKQLQLEMIRRGQELAEQEINSYRHQFPKQGEFSHEFHIIHNELLLVMLVPLKDAQNSLIGYFEGIYLVDRQSLDMIMNDLLRTVLFVTFSITVTTFLMYPIILTLNRGVIRLSSELLQGNLDLMNVLGCAIAERDLETNSHNYRVTYYSLRLAEAIGLTNENIRNLIAGAFLHDVGKIGIRDPILLKPEKLTSEEFEIMKTHVALGVNILNQSNWLNVAREVVEFHHEKYNGSGYLQGLKAEAIPLNARIFCIADVFDALTSKRPYKAPWSVNDAIAKLKQDSGSHFDPQLVNHFVSLAPELFRQVNRLNDDQLISLVNPLISEYFLLKSS